MGGRTHVHKGEKHASCEIQGDSDHDGHTHILTGFEEYCNGHAISL